MQKKGDPTDREGKDNEPSETVNKPEWPWGEMCLSLNMFPLLVWTWECSKPIIFLMDE